MTALNRRVRREIPAARRPLIVMLIPGELPLIEIREKGRRKGFAAPVAAVYVMLAKRAAEQALWEKKQARLARQKERRAGR